MALPLRLPKLRSLTLLDHEEPTWELYAAPLPFPFRLTSLTIDTELILPESHLVPLFLTSLCTLVELSISRLRTLGKLVAEDVLPALQTLHLPYGSWNYDTADILKTLELLPTLPHLSLFPYPEYSCNPPAELLLGLPAHLRSLDLIKVLEPTVIIDYIRGYLSETSPTITIASSGWEEEEAQSVAEVAEKEGWTWKLLDGLYTYKKRPAVAQ